ncbi:hypothetical protein ACWD4T_48975, partial [Streptomyces umbrinus]
MKSLSELVAAESLGPRPYVPCACPGAAQGTLGAVRAGHGHHVPVGHEGHLLPDVEPLLRLQ